MKLIKGLFKLVFWLIVIVLAAVLTLPLWIGPVVKGVANSQVPKITKTEFHLGEFGLNPYRGTLHVGDMQLQNPTRFFTDSEKKSKSITEVKGDGTVLGAVAAHADNIASMAGDGLRTVGDAVSSYVTNAVSIGSLDVRYKTMSFASDTIHIEEIAIRDLFIYGDVTFANIREIIQNATEGGEKEEKPKEKKDEKGGKKVVIDRVLITGAKIQWGHIPVPLPEFEIKDIGKEEGGTDEEGAFDAIVQGICDAADKVCTGVGKALKAAIDGVEAIGNALSDPTKAVGDAVGKGVDAVKDVAGSATDKVKDIAGGATDAVKNLFGSSEEAPVPKDGKAGGGVTDKAKETVKGAADAVGNAAGAATDAVKDAMNGATDKLQNLFK